MKFLLASILALTIMPESINAQSDPLVRTLAVGDTVPPLVLTNVINSADSVIRLSDLRGKLVILDFWSSNCGYCIKLFPDLDSLQREFGDDLAIILVNGRSKQIGDTVEKIQRIIDRYNIRTGRPLSLPVVHDNPLLDQYFHTEALPHEIWLDSNGVVMAITPPEEVTSEHIRAYLNGDKLSLRQKEEYPEFNPEIPLFMNGNGGTGNVFLTRSVFTPYNPAARSMRGFSSNDSTTRLYYFNQPFLFFLLAAYPEAMSLPDNSLWIFPLLTIPEFRKTLIWICLRDSLTRRHCCNAFAAPVLG